MIFLAVGYFSKTRWRYHLYIPHTRTILKSTRCVCVLGSLSHLMGASTYVGALNSNWWWCCNQINPEVPSNWKMMKIWNIENKIKIKGNIFTKKKNTFFKCSIFSCIFRQNSENFYNVYLFNNLRFKEVFVLQMLFINVYILFFLIIFNFQFSSTLKKKNVRDHPSSTSKLKFKHWEKMWPFWGWDQKVPSW